MEIGLMMVLFPVWWVLLRECYSFPSQARMSMGVMGPT
jgi:hypothetical protein